MSFEYKKIKKLDIKKWLSGSNSKIYAIILVVFLTAVIFMLSTFFSAAKNENNNNNNTETSSSTSNEETTTKANDSFVLKDQSYMIKINKTNNFGTIYSLDSSNNYSIVERVFLCSVNPDIKTGKTKINEKSIWRSFSANTNVQYVSKLDNGTFLHSVPYKTQDIYNINVEAYNKLGTPSNLGYISMQSADARWIYENCGINISVEIYEDSAETLPSDLSEFETISNNFGYDPTDLEINKTKVETRINYMTGTDDCTISLNSHFNPMAGVYAVDINGNDISSYIKCTGEVDTSKTGRYRLIYYLSDKYGTELAYYRYVTVE